MALDPKPEDHGFALLVFLDIEQNLYFDSQSRLRSRFGAFSQKSELEFLVLKQKAH